TADSRLPADQRLLPIARRARQPHRFARRREEGAGFRLALALFIGGVAVGVDARAGLDVPFAILDDRGPEYDAAVHVAVGGEIADAARVGPARIGFEFGDDLARAHFRSAADGAGRKAREQRVDRVLAGRDAADDVRDDVHDVAVELD